jgi:hypothetical protein
VDHTGNFLLVLFIYLCYGFSVSSCYQTLQQQSQCAATASAGLQLSACADGTIGAQTVMLPCMLLQSTALAAVILNAVENSLTPFGCTCRICILHPKNVIIVVIIIIFIIIIISYSNGCPQQAQLQQRAFWHWMMDCATLHVIHQLSQFTSQMTTSRRAHHAYNVNLLFQYP